MKTQKNLAERMLSWIAPGGGLARRVKRDEWLRCMVIDLHRILNDPTRAEEDAAVREIQKLDQRVRDKVGRYLLEQVESVADSSNRLLACRNWLMREAREYAPVRALFIDNASYAEEVLRGERHPCNYGLYERISDVVEACLPHLVEKEGSVQAAVEHVRRESCWLHLRLGLANLGRVALNDYQESENWFRTFVNALVAREEVRLRDGLGWRMPCDVEALDREIAALEASISSGHPSPLDGVRELRKAETRNFLSREEAEIAPGIAEVAGTVMRLQLSTAQRHAQRLGRSMTGLEWETQAFAFGLLGSALEQKGILADRMVHVIGAFCDVYLPEFTDKKLLVSTILKCGSDPQYSHCVSAGRNAMIRFAHNPNTEGDESDVDDLAFALGLGGSTPEID